MKNNTEKKESLSLELDEVMKQCFKYGEENNVKITCNHLLYFMLNTTTAIKTFEATGINIKKLKSKLETYLTEYKNDKRISFLNPDENNYDGSLSSLLDTAILLNRLNNKKYKTQNDIGVNDIIWSFLRTDSREFLAQPNYLVEQKLTYNTLTNFVINGVTKVQSDELNRIKKEQMALEKKNNPTVSKPKPLSTEQLVILSNTQDKFKEIFDKYLTKKEIDSLINNVLCKEDVINVFNSIKTINNTNWDDQFEYIDTKKALIALNIAQKINQTLKFESQPRKPKI